MRSFPMKISRLIRGVKGCLAMGLKHKMTIAIVLNRLIH